MKSIKYISFITFPLFSLLSFLAVDLLFLGCNSIPETEQELKDYIVDYVWEINNKDYFNLNTYRLYFYPDGSCIQVYPKGDWWGRDTIRGKYSIIKAEIVYMDLYKEAERTEPKLLIIAPELGFLDTREVYLDKHKQTLYFDTNKQTLCWFDQGAYNWREKKVFKPDYYYLRKIEK